MEHFTILRNTDKPDTYSVAGEISEYLQSHGKQAFVCLDGSEIPDGTDCVLVLGGDGTLLRAAKAVLDRQIPLLGINLGTLGYLAEVDVPGVKPALDQLIAGNYQIEKRMMLTGRITHGDEVIYKSEALNDIVLRRKKPMRTFVFRNYVNGIYLNEYRADGMIVATATGSTGYSLSAGGPIVSPSANLMLMTPIAAHVLNTRSVVLSENDRVEVEIGEGKTGRCHKAASVSFDGSEQHYLDTGDRVYIERAKQSTRILKINNISFLEVLRRKLSD